MPEKLKSWRIKEADLSEFLWFGQWPRFGLGEGVTISPLVFYDDNLVASQTPLVENTTAFRPYSKGMIVRIINVGLGQSWRPR